MIWAGAHKCRVCKRWLTLPESQNSRPVGYTRSAVLVAAAVTGVLAVLISSRPSTVGNAPPLTPIADGSATAESRVAGADAAPPRATQTTPKAIDQSDSKSPKSPTQWKSRELSIDVRPLDVIFSATGRSVYVSGDDASVREYDLRTGKILHMATAPAQGDQLRLINNRYIAIIRLVDAGHIPILDTTNWNRDPILLRVGSDPADIVALPDSKAVVTASSRGKRLSWHRLSSGRIQGNLRLPHSTRQLYLLHGKTGPMIAAMGIMLRARQPAGAWVDLFDPKEEPFGATRRSISVGRDPRVGMVTRDGTSLFFPDFVSNSATMLRLGSTTHLETASVGQGPVAGFLMRDRFGITIESKARTATVLELKKMKRVRTLMLSGSPNFGAVTPDRKTLFVALGGPSYPPRGQGVAIISGDPPRVQRTLKTGRGAGRLATSKDGRTAVVTNYLSRSLTVLSE